MKICPSCLSVYSIEEASYCANDEDELFEISSIEATDSVSRLIKILQMVIYG